MKPIASILLLLALCGCAVQKPEVRSQVSESTLPISGIRLLPLAPSTNSELLIWRSSQSILPPSEQPPFSELAIALQWDADPDADGFNVYCGIATHSYDTVVTVATNYCVLTDLIPGAEYFFNVTAISNSVESDFGNEAAAVFDQTAGRVMRLYSSSFSSSSIERSTNLTDWIAAANCFPIATNSDSQDWFLPNPQTTVFYRLTAN